MSKQQWSVFNVPWERRMQTLAVASFVATLPLIFICNIASIVLLFLYPYNMLFLGYLIYIYLDNAPYTGERLSTWFRGLRWWKNFKDFFPITLIRTESLNPEGKYIFGYHPHGIISFGAFATFATDGLDFSKLFPGIRVHLVTLGTNFCIPFLREFWLRLGICSADRKTFQSVLSQKGRGIAVVVGGAAESLKAAPGTLDLYLARRKGFVRQALLYEAALVPVLAFGETDVYDVEHPPWAEALQARMQKLMGFAVPLFHGRGVFSYDYGIVPYRRPISVVVGAPISLPRTSAAGRRVAELGEGWLTKDEEGTRMVDECHAAYTEAVRGLYEAHKATLFVRRVASMRIN